jgi:hypothetical protein
MQNKDVFSQSKYDIGLTHVIQHKINTGYAAAIKQAARRIPLAQRKEVEDEIDKMLDNNVIIPSQSSWASPIVVVRKKDNSIRLCIDYRKLNQVTVKDSYPLPRINDSLDALRGNSWISTLDLVSGYYQCSVDPQDAPKLLLLLQGVSFSLTGCLLGYHVPVLRLSASWSMFLQVFSGRHA